MAARLARARGFHAAGPTDEGFTVIDVWNSRAAFDRFLQGRLGQAIGEAGVPQPQIREIPIHNRTSA